MKSYPEPLLPKEALNFMINQSWCMCRENTSLPRSSWTLLWEQVTGTTSLSLMAPSLATQRDKELRIGKWEHSEAWRKKYGSTGSFSHSREGWTKTRILIFWFRPQRLSFIPKTIKRFGFLFPQRSETRHCKISTC